jgi:hypothetical protein
VVRGELFRAAVRPGDGDPIRRRETRGALVNVHLTAGQELLHAAGELLHDLVLARNQRGPVDLRLADDDAVLLGALDLLVEMRGHDPRLGGDAAPVQARATQFVLLDDGGLQAQLRGTDRGHITARAGADDDDVVVRHVGTPWRRKGGALEPGHGPGEIQVSGRHFR